MAQKKAGGSTRNGRDSIGKRLGVKRFGGEFVKSGSIIVKQRGTKFHSGINTKNGRDHTIYAIIDGIVEFKIYGKKKRKIINIIPQKYKFQ
ncbi:50S ribosomal protein L27 [Buchnera aphidicola]|uniref:50S ribosomal protein L27 n=1 Tax=Buchnera aphidicola TaxID=9 RepID=UPI0034643A30